MCFKSMAVYRHTGFHGFVRMQGNIMKFLIQIVIKINDFSVVMTIKI